MSVKIVSLNCYKLLRPGARFYESPAYSADETAPSSACRRSTRRPAGRRCREAPSTRSATRLEDARRAAEGRAQTVFVAHLKSKRPMFLACSVFRLPGGAMMMHGDSTSRVNAIRLSSRICLRVTSRAEDLCLSCGLCCDGSLFWAVPVGQGEKVPVPLDAEGRLRQPCACFNGACTIYADRPAACRTFNCRVLQMVQAGRRDDAWAREQIAGMRRLLAALDAALPGDESSLYRRAAEFLARHQNGLSDPAFQRKHRNVLQCLDAYEKALARFHVSDKRRKR